MEYNLNTKLKGSVAITANFHENKLLTQGSDLYKFLWVRGGLLSVVIDHVVTVLQEDEFIGLTPLQHFDFKSID